MEGTCSCVWSRGTDAIKIGTQWVHKSTLHVFFKILGVATTATKTSLENKHLRNGDYWGSIASSSHSLLLTEHAVKGPVEVPLK